MSAPPYTKRVAEVLRNECPVYKAGSGYGKTHKDAASVRTTHPIPAACGLYYFEVKIVSKGRDGYMGIGLSAHGVNVNRLPGWDKNSYGYHGDDGHSFCSSGTGQPYGPTFTTGDIIGCGVNLVDNTAFYTKNGHHLGTAFSDLPVAPHLFTKLFSIVGTTDRKRQAGDIDIVPLLFFYALLSSKETGQYSNVLRAVETAADE
ncbi:hypothetical protein TKK_0015681 [Trichogramma kaykai]